MNNGESRTSRNTQAGREEVEPVAKGIGAKQTDSLPAKIDDAIVDQKTGWAADIRRTRHIGDFKNWKEHDYYQRVFQWLLRDLKASEKEWS